MNGAFGFGGLHKRNVVSGLCGGIAVVIIGRGACTDDGVGDCKATKHQQGNKNECYRSKHGEQHNALCSTTLRAHFCLTAANCVKTARLCRLISHAVLLLS